jgi:predicted Zn-dependent protease with MMP-like domain
MVSFIGQKVEHNRTRALDLTPSADEDGRMRKGRHDRHGRLARANNDRRRRPSDGFRAAHGARFSDLVEDALTELPSALAEAVAGIDMVIEDVPPVGERALVDQAVPLARMVEQAGTRRLVVYRRPLELRGTTRLEVIEAVRIAVGEEVARHLGLDFDELFGDD